MAKKLRIDKVLSNIGCGSRAEIKKYCKQSLIKVNGKVVSNPGLQVDPENDEIIFDGEVVKYREFVYIMLNKPDGYISATYDKFDPIVLDLIDSSYLVFEPFPVGRLDKDTEGLLLITNDGGLSHRLLSPKKHVNKCYYAKIDGVVKKEDVQMFAEADVLEDLKPFFESSDLSEDDFVEGLMGHSTFNEKLVSLPLNRSTPILHVNKTILDEAGLQVPTTWEEMKTVANALVQKEGNEIKRYGLTMPYDTWYPIAMISQSNGSFFNENHTSDGFNKNGIGKEVFGYLKDLQKTGALYYPPAQDTGNIVNQMFSGGKVAMMFQSTGTIGGLSQTADFEYVTAFLPKRDVFATPTGGGNVSMLASSGNKEEAWEFMRFMMDDPKGLQQFILESGYLPFTNKMAESTEMQELWAKEPNRKTAYEQLEYAIDTNKHTAWPEIMHEFFSAIEAIMYDDADIQKSLDTFSKETERILSQ